MTPRQALFTICRSGTPRRPSRPSTRSTSGRRVPARPRLPVRGAHGRRPADGGHHRRGRRPADPADGGLRRYVATITWAGTRGCWPRCGSGSRVGHPGGVAADGVAYALHAATRTGLLPEQVDEVTGRRRRGSCR